MPKMSFASQKLKMARWIEKGLLKRNVRECRTLFLQDHWCCANSLAMIGKFGSYKAAKEEAKKINSNFLLTDGVEISAKALGVSGRLTARVNVLHLKRWFRATMIVKLLRAEAKKAKRTWKPKPRQDWFNRGNKP